MTLYVGKDEFCHEFDNEKEAIKYYLDMKFTLTDFSETQKTALYFQFVNGYNLHFKNILEGASGRNFEYNEKNYDSDLDHKLLNWVFSSGYLIPYLEKFYDDIKNKK